MARNIIATSNSLSYLQECVTSESLSAGLIFGQICQGKNYICHMAKTSMPQENFKNITDINILSIADHAKQATKMLSGGMYVIGIFIVSQTDLISSFPAHLKAVLHQLNKSLLTEYLCGNSGTNEKIVLNYCSNSKNVKCKVYDTSTAGVRPAEIKFSDEITWVRLDCKYEICENYCWEEKGSEMDLKQQMNIILKDVCKNLKSAVILFDGEFKSEDESLESARKKKEGLKSGKSSYENIKPNNKPIIVHILEDNEDQTSDAVIKDTNNQMKVVGQISSTVWMNPQISYKKVRDAIIEDIVRSLSTRLEMHCDSLIEEEHKEDLNSIHEPPRRVMIAVPGSDITVSDYLFPGEGAEEAKSSVEEILDIKLDGTSDEIQEVEGSIDISNYGSNISKMVEGKLSEEDKSHGHKLFIFGSIFALLVLVISILVHFVLKNS
ncbi:protein odr-4 homolog [Coccinella septempunctata]|uniref:protein odr-4 homolog n=1 Tax=Coccinella septempunctata TaxID=41139 RepID=UPI001D085101|nr:protein odr-4 homolog [Coccinella septempunctata]